ncbi:transposase [Kalymmatonema gypsitolerans NIES-4073]|nr:transposase [Scytonema sp. NIES-4073]
MQSCTRYANANARVAGLNNHQPLHHFLTESPWEAAALRRQRLELILLVLKGRPVVLIIDETGDKKKGNKTAACETTIYRKPRKDGEWHSCSDSLCHLIWNDISIDV